MIVAATAIGVMHMILIAVVGEGLQGDGQAQGIEGLRAQHQDRGLLFVILGVGEDIEATGAIGFQPEVATGQADGQTLDLQRLLLVGGRRAFVLCKKPCGFDGGDVRVEAGFRARGSELVVRGGHEPQHRRGRLQAGVVSGGG